MTVYVAKAMWDCMSENICVANNLALAMRNVLAWLTPYNRIVETFMGGDGTVYITLANESQMEIVIERFMVNDIIEAL
jgi:hypothetical protein